MSTTLHLKPIDELLTERFFVPSYQRGFRWTERQVTELLNDIWDFQQNCERKDEFYCLQPIVVKKRLDGAWELVDGQQRLTTIFLILTYYDVIVTRALRKQRFRLTYETRPNSAEFLNQLNLDREDENIDYFHICKAYRAIKDWSESRSGSQDLNLIQCLTNDEESGKNVKVIWYELPSGQDPVAAFTRLNVGKIPLTSAELIRALFLRSRNFESGDIDLQQIKIAQEWDGIEKVLQSDEVWYFLNAGADDLPSRIEFVFQRLAESSEVRLDGDPYATFHYFHERLAVSNNPEAEWLSVKQCFMTFEEWFNDRVLYHLVGYLVYQGVSLRIILSLGRNLTKQEFRKSLKERILKGLIGSVPNQEQIQGKITEFIEELEYEGQSRQIRSVFLLFNIATLILAEKSNIRFPFDYFKKEKWDIEHVHSVKSEKPDNKKSAIAWLSAFCSYIGKTSEGDDIAGRCREMLEREDFELAEFDNVFADVLGRFQDEDDEDYFDNGIGNLTLLDAATNRSYKNAVFPIKRQRILDLERNGMFVPLCTKNVFLKSYSPNIGRMFFWAKSDRDGYKASIVTTLNDFFADLM